ncbi:MULTISPECIES: hypothetical protein [Lactobacillaceae]|uniref:hypothetical protein n=1 Tax=Lactobacillaceae TaxID=33958 RepID=UPI0014569172|nr:hypothetical protein [Lactobacillus sp. HBUAS51381]NLR08675.1 hypothetical protein [Lactobacillus sp. HBUAS51381]
MDFEVEAIIRGQLVRFWWINDGLQCSDVEAMSWFKRLLDLHIPQETRIPGGLDYTNDLSDGANAFRAVTGVFEDSKVLIEPSDEFMGFDKNVIY